MGANLGQGEQVNCESKSCELRVASCKFKNIRTAYEIFLNKKKSVPSGSEKDAVPVPREFANLGGFHVLRAIAAINWKPVSDRNRRYDCSTFFRRSQRS